MGLVPELHAASSACANEHMFMTVIKVCWLWLVGWRAMYSV
jgi:hypothetical protein